MPDKPGRPKDDVRARSALIESARSCFLHNSYDRVSLRRIAQKAGVDAAMIRYYFGSKAGLFEAMLRETLAPVAELLQQNMRGEVDSPEVLMAVYYKMMAMTPALPRLIFQVLNQQENQEAYTILSGIFREMFGHSGDWVKLASEQQRLNPDLDPNLVRLSFLSLMVFPLIAPKLLLEELDLTICDATLETLLAHNTRVMTEGLFRASQPAAAETGVKE